MADALTHRAGAPTAHGRWVPLHGGQGSISLEYQTCTSPYPFDTLVTGMAQSAPELRTAPGDEGEGGHVGVEHEHVAPFHDQTQTRTPIIQNFSTDLDL